MGWGSSLGGSDSGGVDVFLSLIGECCAQQKSCVGVQFGVPPSVPSLASAML